MATVTPIMESLCNVRPVSPAVERRILGVFTEMEAQADQRYTIAGPKPPRKRSAFMKVMLLVAKGHTVAEAAELLVMPKRVAVAHIDSFRRYYGSPISELRRICSGLTEQEIATKIRCEVDAGKGWAGQDGVA